MTRSRAGIQPRCRVLPHLATFTSRPRVNVLHHRLQAAHHEAHSGCAPFHSPRRRTVALMLDHHALEHEGHGVRSAGSPTDRRTGTGWLCGIVDEPNLPSLNGSAFSSISVCSSVTTSFAILPSVPPISQHADILREAVARRLPVDVGYAQPSRCMSRARAPRHAAVRACCRPRPTMPPTNRAARPGAVARN